MEPIVIRFNENLPVDTDRFKLLTKMNFYRASFNGGADYKNSLDTDGETVLIPHEQESEIGYKRRKRSATYHNHCKPIIQKFNNLVFSSPIVRAQASGMWSDFMDDCDFLGTDLQNFIRRAVQNAQIDGSRYAIFESSKNESVLTVAQALISNARPYLVDIDPRTVLAERQLSNRLLQILIRVDKNSARLYDDTNVTIIRLNDAGVVIGMDITPHGFNRIPVIKFLANDEACSQLTDIAEVAKALFNLDALLSEEQARQVFTQWFAAGLDVTPTDPSIQGQGQTLTPVTIGGRTLIATSNPNVSFTKLIGDSSQSQSLMESMLKKVEEIQRLSGMRDPKVQEASGRALKILFDEALMQAKMISANAEHAENDVIDLFNNATGSGVGYTQYPPTFLGEDRGTDLTQLLSALAAELPPTLQKAFVERFIAQHFADLPEDQKAEIERQLEVMLNKPDPKDEEEKVVE